MKQTITEIFIEVEETIRVKSAPREKSSAENAAKDENPVIEICPHCHRAIFAPVNNEIEGDLEI